MYHIAIISSSIRTGRKSHNVTLYLKNFLEESKLATVEILDLLKFNFPLFDERLSKMPNPSSEVTTFQNSIIAADGIMIVTPEYNGSIPASLKNVIDLLYEEWNKKPIAFSTVSSGAYAGLQGLTHLQFIFYKIRAYTCSSSFPMAQVQDKFDDFGNATNKKEMDALAQVFINEFIKCIDSSQK